MSHTMEVFVLQIGEEGQPACLIEVFESLEGAVAYLEAEYHEDEVEWEAAEHVRDTYVYESSFRCHWAWITQTKVHP